MATASTSTVRSWRATLDDFRALRGAPRELWIVFAVKFLESLAYFAIYNLIALYLSADLGYTDVEAGTVAGTWLTVISVMTFFSGFVADALSIRRALLVSVTSCVVGRVLLAVSTARPVALLALGVMSWGVASMMPTMTAAVRRYTSRRTVSFMAASTTPAASVAFIVTLSLGEALWSPRLYEYTATIAPRGREASYMGLSQLPMFLAKPIVGTLSGAMLTAWCPAQGVRHPQTLWLVIGLSTLAGPIAIVLLRGVIQPKSALPAPAPAAG